MERYRTLCLMFQLAFLFSILLINDCIKLEGYKFPVFTTELCPKNEKEWDERSSFANCKKGESYACLPNENITELLEFCYPGGIIQSHKGICLYLRKDRSQVDSYNCRHFEHGCPTGYYSGSTIYEYPSCVLIGNGCFLAESSCKRATDASVQRTSTLDTLTTESDQSHGVSERATEATVLRTYTPDTGTTEGGLGHSVWESSTPQTTQDVERDSDVSSMVWILSGVGVLILVFPLLICIAFLIHRQRKLKSSNVDRTHNDVESPGEQETALLHDTDQNTELQSSSGTRTHTDVESPGEEEETALLQDTEQNTETEHEKSIFLQWQQEDEFFISTRAAEEVDKMIKTNNLVIVVGHSGSGKSAIVQHVALKYRENGWIVKPVYSVKEIHDAKISDNVINDRTLFVCNDPIGKESVDDFLINSWKQYRETIDILIKNVKFLMTCRRSILDNPKAEGFLKQIRNTVCIDDSDLKFSQEEKKLMFKKHVSGEHLTDEDFSKILETDTYFPLLCKLSREKHTVNILKFFSEPMEILKEELYNYRNYDKEKYCSLVCLVLFNNEVSLRKLQENSELFTKCSILGGLSPTTSTPSLFIKQLQNLTGFFIKQTGNIYSFYHDFVMEVTTYVLGTEHPGDIIKHADISFLKKRITLGKKHTEFIISINEDYIGDLVNRLFEELFGDRFLEVVLNPCLKDEKVISGIITKLKEDKGKLEIILNPIITERKIKRDDILTLDFWVTLTREKSYSRLDFVSLATKLSPLFALIAFCHNDLSCFCLNEIKHSKQDLNISVLFPAICCNGSKEVFQMLTKDEIGKHVKEDLGGLYPIHVLSLFHNFKLLEDTPINSEDVNMFSKLGSSKWTHRQWTPLCLAIANDTEETEEPSSDTTAAFRRDETVKRLIQSGANVNLCIDIKISPLSVACIKGHGSTIKLLLNKGADVNLCDDNRTSPLLDACQFGDDSIVQLLLDNGADVNLCRIDGTSPLTAACARGYDSIVRLLLDNGVEANICCNDGISPLHAACSFEHDSIVHLLLSNGAEVNSRSKDGNIPLGLACYFGYDSIVQLLLNNGAEVNLCNYQGASPLLAACDCGHDSTVRLLLNNGADVNLYNKDGVGPLYIARKKGYESIIQLLIDSGAEGN